MLKAIKKLFDIPQSVEGAVGPFETERRHAGLVAATHAWNESSGPFQQKTVQEYWEFTKQNYKGSLGEEELYAHACDEFCKRFNLSLEGK